MARANGRADEIGADQETVDLLWGLREAATRGPRPGLTVEMIARAAVEIADVEGLEAISMQRVAAALDVTKMALYRYVAGKSDLTAVMIELAVEEPPDLSGTPGGWRARVEEFVRRLAEVWRRHPWLPWATVGDRVMGPREVGWVESAVATLDGTGLTAAERMDAVFVLFGHIRNTQSMVTAGTQPWDADKQYSPLTRRMLAEHAERYPALTRVAADAAGASPDNGRSFGLRCILEGLELIVAERDRRPAR